MTVHGSCCRLLAAGAGYSVEKGGSDGIALQLHVRNAAVVDHARASFAAAPHGLSARGV